MNLHPAGGNRAVVLVGMLCAVFWLPVSAADPAAPMPRALEIEVVAHKPVGGARTVRLTRGDSIVLRIRSDEPLAVHIHGYEAHVEVTSGAVATLPLVARIEGRFPVTAHLPRKAGSAHGAEPTLMYLEVYPP
jgi:hypothetical protein